MFGRQKRQAHGGEEVDVDAALEQHLGAVESSTESYLKDPSTGLRSQLLAALERLDQQIDASDRYGASIYQSGAWGYSAKGSVIGETSDVPTVEEVPGSEFRAQTALIRAAKREVSAPTPASLAELRAAQEALAACRGQVPPAQ
jgi:hypothetical protein